ncbi:MAG: TolC family protein [Oligoflexia bacterium]|nr:TolC family protein [Oligoflexia bacterium]
MPRLVLIRILMLSNFFLFNVYAESLSLNSENIKSHLEAKNLKVAAAKYNAEAASEREGSFLRSFLPTAELSGEQELFKTAKPSTKNQAILNAEAKINIFNGGRDKLVEDTRLLETEKQKLNISRAISEEIEKARVLYWNILYLREKILLLKNAIKVNTQNLDSAIKRIRSGVATNSDRFEFEIQEVDLKRELTQVEAEYVNQTKVLHNLIGFDKETKLVFSEPLLHDHQYEGIFNKTIKHEEYIFRVSEIHAEQSKIRAKENKRFWWPKLDAFASYEKNYESDNMRNPAMLNEETAFGLRLSMNLSSGFESLSEAKAQFIESSAEKVTAQFLKQESEILLETEIAQLKLLHDQVHEAEQNIGRAENYYKITQSEYSRGVKNSPDVLGASEKLFNMRHKHLEIIKNFQISKSHILSRIGM